MQIHENQRKSMNIYENHRFRCTGADWGAFWHLQKNIKQMKTLMEGQNCSTGFGYRTTELTELIRFVKLREHIKTNVKSIKTNLG